MSRADGILVISLAFRWWDMIQSGEKLEEYRGAGWADRLISAEVRKDPHPDDLHHPWGGFYVPYHTLRAQRAYTGVWLERKIRRIRWGTPRPEWSGGLVPASDCFVIELEPAS